MSRSGPHLTVGNLVRKYVGDAVGAIVVGQRVRFAMLGAILLGDSLGGSLGAALGDSLGAALGDSLGAALGGSLGAALGAILLKDSSDISRTLFMHFATLNMLLAQTMFPTGIAPSSKGMR